MKKNKNELYSNIIFSFISMILCTICFIGSTSAWFTSMKTTTTQIITSANYSVDIKVENSEENSLVLPNLNEVYELPMGSYIITLTAKGSASTGFCIITLEAKEGDTKKYYTEKFPQDGKNKSIYFNLNITSNTTMKVITSWGKYDEDIKFILVEGIEFPMTESSVIEQEENITESFSDMEESIKESEVESSQETTEETTKSIEEFLTEEESPSMEEELSLEENLFQTE